MFPSRYSCRRLNVVLDIFLLTSLVYFNLVYSDETGNWKPSSTPSNGTISGNDMSPIDRRKLGAHAKNVSTTSERRQSINHNSMTSRQQYYPSNEDKDDYRVPFWNIAHMINSIDEIEPAIRVGANGIETDISFDGSGQPVETFHGFPCDCGRHCYSRENFVKFIEHIGHITTPPETSNLQLVVLDLKLSDLNANQKMVAGKQMAAVIDQFVYRKYLPALKELKRQQNYMLQNRLEFMSKYVGFDVGMNDNLTDISSMWDEFNGITMNIWQGDGLTNCANVIRGVKRLKQAIDIRNGQGHFKKIYYWTADIMYQVRSVLRLGLDASLTNQPQRVVQILQEPEFNSKYRLATAYDDPFAQFQIKPSSLSASIPTLKETLETVTNIRETGRQYIRTLPNGINVALQKVQESIIPG